MNDAFDIEELLKDNLLNKSKEPPIGMFQEIEDRLVRRKRRRRLFWVLFWLGLGIGAYFTGVYFLTMFTTECDCSTAENNRIKTEKTKQFIEPASKDTINARTIYIENEVPLNNVNLVSAVEKVINYTSSLEDENLSEPDSHDASEANIEAAQINDLALFESNKMNIVSEPDLYAIKTGSIQGENHSIIRPDRTENIVGEIGLSESNNHSKIASDPVGNSVLKIKDSRSILASIIEALHDSISISSSQLKFPEIEILPQDKIGIASELTDKHPNYGLTVFGGPSFFDIAVFKPYLYSGSLTNRPFKSSGYELGVGGFKKINERWQLNLAVAYNHKSSQFQYDLLVSEADYFNYYNNDVLISLEQLDQEENCNCFVANAVQMKYDVNTIKLSIGMSYQLAEFKKFNIHGNFNVSSNVLTRFQNNSSSVVNFLSEKTEKFNTLGLKPGFSINYALTKNTRLTLSPNYTFLFTQARSSFYARPVHEIIVPLGITLLL